MNRSIYLFILSCFVLLGSCKDETLKTKGDYTYKDVDFTHVHVNDNFWSKRLETVRTVTIPYAFQKCEETGRIDNFAIAGGLMEGKFRSPFPFDDSDVFKIMEGASFVLSMQKDEKLDAYMDSLITLVASAQEPDGYLFTNRTINNPLHFWLTKNRWETEWDHSHETYNAGHMYEAAVAHYLATGKRNFLDVAIKNANLMCETFNEKGLRMETGHQEIELALVKLYRITGEKKYLDLSRYFLEARGRSDRFDANSEDNFRNGRHWQNHIPVTQQKEAVGHAVRATYMYSAMADIAALMDDAAYLNAIDTIWANIVDKKMYITGGIGSTAHGEAFGKNYELPNETAYCETCAAIGNCMFNHRMFMLHGDSKYIDVLERSLYNNVLSGLDMAGDKYFYPNELECGVNGKERSPWFDCSCCPSNLARFIPSVPGYMYATDNKNIYVNLFIGSDSEVKRKDGTVKISQQTNYPWEGNVTLTIDPQEAKSFNLKIRIPGWAKNEVVPSDLYSYANPTAGKTKISVNGKEYDYKVEKGYAVIKNSWKANDKIEISFPMEVKKVKAHPEVKADKDRLSVEYGPIVYCAEFADNDVSVRSMVISDKTQFITEYKPNFLNGMNVLKGNASFVEAVEGTKDSKETDKELTLIPYYGRSHRGNGEMTVWLLTNPEVIQKRILKAYNIIDEVLIGNEASEKAHNLQGKNTGAGRANGNWRHATDGGWFSYDMKVTDEPLELALTYFSQDGGNRSFDILADGKKIAEQKLRTETFTDFIERKYPIPADIIKGKKKVTIKLQALPENTAGGIFGCKIQRAE